MQSLLLSGHLHSGAELGQQSTVATMLVCQATLAAGWPSCPLLF